MESLLKLQRCFKQAVTRGDRAILHLLKDNNPKFPPEQRVESYRYAIGARFEESLLEDFPMLTKTLGEEAFKEILVQYLLEYPSRTYNLSEVSLDLPKYFEKHPLKEHPYVQALAEFEVERLYADNSEENPAAISMEHLGAEDLSTIKLIFDTSVRLFTSEWSLLASPIIKRPFFALMYEQDFVVHNMELTKDMFDTIKNLLEGQSLPQAAAHLGEDQAPAISNLFSELVRLQVIIGFERIQ